MTRSTAWKSQSFALMIDCDLQGPPGQTLAKLLAVDGGIFFFSWGTIFADSGCFPP